MATTSSRTTTATFTGDFTSSQDYSAASNSVSPAQVQVVTLASGNNTITPPASGTTPVACLIVPPSGNVTLITLKGVAGDTGIPLHKTDHTVIAVDTTLSTFVLNAAAQISGVRLVWF